MTDPFALHFHTHHHHHAPGSEHGADILAKLAALGEQLMTISDEVQAVLDLARQNDTLVGSIDQAMKALGIQVTDLQNQLNALSANAPLSPDDKAALLEAASDLQTSIKTLQADIPTNVSAVQPAPTAAPSVPAAAADQHAADAQAASQAQPLAGTSPAPAAAPSTQS